MNDDHFETLHAATISLLAEGVAVVLFFAMVLIWSGYLSGAL